MFTEYDVRAAYFANQCKLEAENGGYPLEAEAVYGLIGYDEKGFVDREETAKIRREALDMLAHGLSILEKAELHIGARQHTSEIDGTHWNYDSPVLIVCSGFIGQAQAYRQVSLVRK